MSSSCTCSRETQNATLLIRKKADWYDPFAESYDELLHEVDKEELTFKKQTWSWG